VTLSDEPASEAPPADAALDAKDDALLAEVDAEMQRVAERAGPALGCRAGRTDCCHGSFPINMLDAHRLLRGLAALERDDPDRARTLQRRAGAAADRLSTEAAVDAGSGGLRDDDAAQERLYEERADEACPALDPATGRCDLYTWRPLACRTMGPPVRIGESDLPPCPHCFVAPTVAELESCRARPDPEAREDALVDSLEVRLGVGGETLVALALARRVRGLR
jgi:Fe-S-cluster containining protein